MKDQGYKYNQEEKKFQPIIGLEVHVELATKSKMFCGCSAEHFGVEPNTHTCPVCLALPGALPVPNRKAIEWTIKLALAIGCEVNLNSKFDRKNYFYPDLPKGYQITQFDEPFGVNGKVSIKGVEEVREIRVRRVHLEEDTGKLQHTEIEGERVTLVDFNRSGVPLVEIVTEPDFRTIDEVDQYLKKLQKIIRYLEISQADMDKGSMRLEPSISLREIKVVSSEIKEEIKDKGKEIKDRKMEQGFLEEIELPNYRVELKNINSFRFARRALEYEIKRQTEILEKGEKVSQQTRGWNEAKGVTVPQREKEEAHDYRYFPEPDIPPMQLTKLEIRNSKLEIPELSDAKLARFIKDYGLSEYDAGILVEDREVADYFEEAVRVSNEIKVVSSPSTTLRINEKKEKKQEVRSERQEKIIANWIINKKVDITQTVPATLVRKILESQKETNVDTGDLTKIIEQVLIENFKAVEDYKKGKTTVIMFLVGKVRSKIPADSLKIREELERALAS